MVTYRLTPSRAAQPEPFQLRERPLGVFGLTPRSTRSRTPGIFSPPSSPVTMRRENSSTSCTHIGDEVSKFIALPSVSLY